MNVLFCASEAAPFAASGGLGDVAGSLPRAIRNRKVACRVVMPLYGDMKQEYREKLTYITNFTVPVGWRNQYCGLFELTHNGVKYYFLDNEYYFKRTGLYGFYDDGERFAFFSRAILEMLFHVDFVPDVIHANDWQTALVPVYLNLYYRHLEQYRSIKTVFTIHNIQYQGKYGMEILEDTLAIGRQDAHLVEYDGCVNFMKGAIECADKVTTVSPSYAGEILDPWYSHGLDDLLRQKQYKRLLCPENVAQLFPTERPVYTKVRDEAPVRYAMDCQVHRCIVADGCIIEGEVENCVLFRGVKVSKGAKVKNCVLMQGTTVEPGVTLDYIVTDKNVTITADKHLRGNESFPVYVEKNTVV